MCQIQAEKNMPQIRILGDIIILLLLLYSYCCIILFYYIILLCYFINALYYIIYFVLHYFAVFLKNVTKIVLPKNSTVSDLSCK